MHHPLSSFIVLRANHAVPSGKVSRMSWRFVLPWLELHVFLDSSSTLERRVRSSSKEEHSFNPDSMLSSVLCFPRGQLHRAQGGTGEVPQRE